MSMAAAALARRRAQEDILRSREERVLFQAKADQVSRWEDRMARSAERRGVLDGVRRREERDRADLDRRREEVRDLYLREMATWIEEVKLGQAESEEEKTEKIRKRAFLLKERREAEREKFVRECYDRRWRDACDEARTVDSRAATDRLVRDRRNALEDGEARRREAREEARHDEEARRRAEELEEKERAEREERRRANTETKLALDAQVEARRAESAADLERRRREERDQLERWREEDERVRGDRRRAAEEARRRGEETIRSNAVRREARERDAASEREQNVVTLRYALDKERREIDDERARRRRGKNEAREYVDFLREQTRRRREEDDRVESIRNEEMEKIWIKRDGELRAQAEARRRLMEEVNESRREQMREQAERIEQERAELAEHFLQNMEEWRRQEEAEREGVARAKGTTVANMEENRTMMEQRVAERERERQEKHLMSREIQYAERLHQERLSQTQGAVRTYHPRKHTKWYT